MPSLPDIPMSYGISLTEDYKVKTINYGENYSSRTSEGHNAVRQRWKWRWNGVNKVQAELLRVFFATQKGTASIQWIPDGQTVQKSFVTSSGFRATFRGFDNFNCSVDVLEVFDHA